VAAAYTQFQQTDVNQVNMTPVEGFNAWLDLDPRRDDNYTLNTAGLNLLTLRLNMAIAEQAWVTAYESITVQ
jgi:hypothetical protein